MATRKTVRMREGEVIAIMMRCHFSDRVTPGAPMLVGEHHLSAVDIDVEGLTHSDLRDKGLTLEEAVFLLGC